MTTLPLPAKPAPDLNVAFARLLAIDPRFDFYLAIRRSRGDVCFDFCLSDSKSDYTTPLMTSIEGPDAIIGTCIDMAQSALLEKS